MRVARRRRALPVRRSAVRVVDAGGCFFPLSVLLLLRPYPQSGPHVCLDVRCEADSAARESDGATANNRAPTGLSFRTRIVQTCDIEALQTRAGMQACRS